MEPLVNTLFFDMNSFFASVWQAEEPALQGCPLGVIAADAPGASLIAASAEAKAAGVRGIVRMQEAQRLCPDIEFREAQHDLFVEYHHRIRDAVETVLPISAAHSVDEFSCHLTGSQRQLSAALKLGTKVQSVILEQISPALTCSVGVAPNKLLAKIAAELEKPMGLNWLGPANMPDRIAHLPLTDLPGVSKGVMARLTSAGIGDVRSLYAMAPKAARRLWGNVEGERFIRQLQGEQVVYPETERSSLGHGQLLTPKNRTAEGARLVARRLLVKVGARLRRENAFARTLRVSVKCALRGTCAVDEQIMATKDSFALLDAFDRYWARLRFQEPLSVSVTVGLEEDAEHLQDLFAPAPDPTEAEKPSAREELCRKIDALNARFGQDTVRYGELPPHKVAYTGAKIVFGRIPDKAEFSE